MTAQRTYVFKYADPRGVITYREHRESNVFKLFTDAELDALTSGGVCVIEGHRVELIESYEPAPLPFPSA